MKLFSKSKGAVSIFLVIILVPMLLVTALFVDASKIMLGKSMAESAGALTMNTALTNYDSDLKELYGLVATSQDMDDLFSRLEDYYRTCIVSTGVSAAEADTYVGQIMATLGVISESNDASDIMNMEIADFSVEKFSGASLANASILERQVVDFMKYRCPINTGLSFLESLKSFTTLSKQTELVEKKEAYYKAQQGVMENLKSAWGEIAKYNATDVGKDSNYMTKIRNSINSYENGPTVSGSANYGYRRLTQYALEDFYEVNETQSAIQFGYQVSQLGSIQYYGPYNNTLYIDSFVTDDDVQFYRVGYVAPGSPIYYPKTYGDITREYNTSKNSNTEWTPPREAQIRQTIQTYESAKNSAESWKADLDLIASSYVNTHYKMQYLLQKMRAGYESYCASMMTLNSSYHLLKAQMLWVDLYGVEGYNDILDENDVVITPQSIKNNRYKPTSATDTRTIQQCWEQIHNDYCLKIPVFKNDAGRMRQLALDLQTNVREGKSYNTLLSECGEDICNIQNEAVAYVESLEKSSGYLEQGIKYLNDAYTQMQGNVASAQQAWKNVAEDTSISDTTLAKQDQAEIGQLGQNLNATNILKLKTRLEKVKEKIDEAIAQIRATKMGDRFVGDIGGVDQLARAVEDKVTNYEIKHLPLDSVQLHSKVNGWIDQYWHKGDVKDDWVNQSGTQPILTQDQLAMYTYLYAHFSGTEDATSSDKGTETATENEEDGKKLYESIKETAKKEAGDKANGTDSGQAGTETLNNNYEIKPYFGTETVCPSYNKGNGSEVPSGKVETKIDDEKDNKGAAGKSSETLNSMFGGGLSNAIMNATTDLRDKLYFADYVMSMFSYDTIENEYKVIHNKTDISPGDLLSLTKNDISQANNYAYGTEVEYIIYGGLNSENLTKAYGSIFAIRFAFNLVYAFATSEIRESAFAIATPISAATLGIIPVPLIQAIIIIGVACAESGMDLSDLRDGQKVPLYKSSKTWRCSISGMVNYAKNKAGTIIKDVASKGIDAGVNKLNDFLDMTDEELTKAIASGTGEIEAAVGQAYDQIITENVNAVIEQLTSYVNSAVENVKFLEQQAGQTLEETYQAKKTEAISNIKSQIQQWGAQHTGNDFPSKVKREAANLIANSCDDLIEELFDTVEETLKSAEVSSAISGTIPDPSSIITDSVDQLGGDIMSTVAVIRRELMDQVISASSEINSYKTQMIDEVKTSAAQGASKLKETLNGKIDGIFGGGYSSDKGTGAASLCSFRYSDYLRLFLLIGMYANEEKVVLRTADVIQVNMAHVKHNQNYRLANSSMYIKMQADVQVKPTLLALPLFSNVANNPADNQDWYTIHFESIAGY